MKHLAKAPVVARILLGLLFIIFAANFWLKFMPTPPAEPGSPAANFIGAMFGSGYLTVVKVLELTAGILLVSGFFVNLGLLLIGPVILNIALYNVMLAQGNYGMTAVLGILALVALAGRKDLLKTITAMK
ncbi:MAG: hypothetical protein AAGA58_00795 [Verrucomicrobiota bacterium]